MRAVMFVLVAACGGASDCPSVETLAGNDPAAQREIKIVVERCAADRWSKNVTDCLRRAATDALAQEKCFDALTPAQKASLEKAFAPIGDEYDRAERTSLLGTLDEDIAALRLDELVTRAPACGEIKTALQRARDQLATCKRPDALQTYGITQQAKRAVDAMRAITDATQLAAECSRVAKDLTINGDGCS